ncbi:MAG: phosphatidylglycerol lysyltransferase domain-containing protein [Phycisphaerales bacterium]
MHPVLAIARLLASRSARSFDVASAAEIDRAKDQVQRWSPIAMPLALAGGDKAAAFTGRIGHVVYQCRGPFMVILSDPVCAPGHEAALLRRVDRLARARGLRPLYYMHTPRWMPLLHDFGMRFFKLGAEAVVDLHGFSLEGPAMAYLRRVERRAAADGLRFEIHERGASPALADEARRVSDDWLARRGTGEKQFSQAHFSPLALARLPVAAVRDRSGRLAAFMSLLARPGCPEVTIDLLRADRDHGWALSHALVLGALRWAADRGYASFNLSMAPVHTVGTERSGHMIERLARRFSKANAGPFNDDGLRRFKDVYGPRWRPRYLAYPGGAFGLARALWQTTSLVMAVGAADQFRIARARAESLPVGHPVAAEAQPARVHPGRPLRPRAPGM